jgi:hypothetical protein
MMVGVDAGRRAVHDQAAVAAPGGREGQKASTVPSGGRAVQTRAPVRRGQTDPISGRGISALARGSPGQNGVQTSEGDRRPGRPDAEEVVGTSHR